MEENLKSILTDNTEVLLDTLIDNEILKGIPILGTSLKLISGIQNIRDKAYLNKVRYFVESIGEIDEKKKKTLIEESKKDEKRRTKFGDAIFSAIEQSDSLLKVKYLAVAFEAFLNNDFDESNLRLICHIIKNTFTDLLTDIIENDKPQNIENAALSGLAEEVKSYRLFPKKNQTKRYALSTSANQLREAWQKYSISNC